MITAYLVMPSQRRIIPVAISSDIDVCAAIDCGDFEHGTTFATEDQLIVNGDELEALPEDQFWVAGVPFRFVGNAVLIGIRPADGDIADMPTMTIDEFRGLVTFATSPPNRLMGTRHE